MKTQYLALIVAIVASVGQVLAEEPHRDAGLSVHLMPERVGRLMGETGGFDVRSQTAVSARKLFSNADQLYEFVRTLPATVQANGVWVVISNPSAYERSELDQLTALERLCKKGEIPLFVARASELPAGWQRKN